MPRFAVYLLATSLVASLSSVSLADEDTKSATTEGDWRARIERALESEFSFKGTDVPLAEFADQVSDRAGITVLVDRRFLDDVGMGDDVPLSRNLRGISLRSVMRLVLKELDLTYDVREGALVITTPEDADSNLNTQFYDVTDLAGDESPAGSGRVDCDELTRLITSTVAPTAWASVGGSGEIAACRGRLVVSQTCDVHDAIRDMLFMIRKAKRLSRTDGSQTPSVVCIDQFEDDPVVRRIRQLLHRPISVCFQEEPLERVVAQLRDMLDVNVEVDTRALDDVGIGTDLPVTFRAANMRLEFVLRHILRELDLAYVIRNQVLLITTSEEWSSEFVTRLYPVGDLLGPIHSRDLFGDPVRPASINELIQSMTAMVTTHDWDRVGGWGSIARFADEDFLIITQDDYSHKEIVHALTQFRASLANPATAAESDADNVATRASTRLVVYFVQSLADEQSKSTCEGGEEAESIGGTESPSAHAQAGTSSVSSLDETHELLALVVELIEMMGGDARDDVYARALPGRLVIRHTDDVHQQIEKLLAKLRVRKEDAQPQPWTGGPSGGGVF